MFYMFIVINKDTNTKGQKGNIMEDILILVYIMCSVPICLSFSWRLYIPSCGKFYTILTINLNYKIYFKTFMYTYKHIYMCIMHVHEYV